MWDTCTLTSISIAAWCQLSLSMTVVIVVVAEWTIVMDLCRMVGGLNNGDSNDYCGDSGDS